MFYWHLHIEGFYHLSFLKVKELQNGTQQTQLGTVTQSAENSQSLGLIKTILGKEG